jgi:Zn-dependent protease
MRPTLDNPLSWSVPLLRVSGIVVRVHAILLLFAAISLLRALFPAEGGTLGLGPTALALACLFAIVFAHELGHCAACRSVGGEADEILMWPLGGLAFCRPGHRWSAHLITTLGGPAVNVLLLAVLAPLLGLATGLWWGVAIPNPFALEIPAGAAAPLAVLTLYLANWTNLVLLLFNVALPVFPFDGGRILQAALWPRLGYGRSMRIAVRSGYFGALALGIIGFVMQSVVLVMIALFGGVTCYMTSRQLEFTDEFMGVVPEGPSRPSWRKRRRAAREAREARERRRVDAVLRKISESGLESLSFTERRLLRRETRRRQQESPPPR